MIGYISKTLSILRIDGLLDTVREYIPEDRRVLSLLIAAVVIMSLGLAVVIPVVTNASEVDLIQNGSFEAPFIYQDGCGTVGSGWNCFTNGGVSNFGFYDDQWDLVVAEGDHSQLIEINTVGMAAADNGRFAGLSQTIRVQPHAKYTFSMQGSIRTSELDAEDPYRYTVEVGFVEEPNGNWKDVDNWTDTGWYEYGELDRPITMAGFTKYLYTEDTEIITLFIRVERKWGTANQELDVNIDNIRLRGPAVGQNPQQHPSNGPSGQAVVVNPNPPHSGTGGACVSQDFVFNGDFENGFIQSGYGTVGRGWGAFTNGGAANYGFYDEQWEAVISSSSRSTSKCAPSNPCVSSQAIDLGCGGPQPCNCDDDEECAGNGQLIEINTKNHWPADADRYAGIYQQIGGLTPGAPYTIRLKGLLRGTGDENDKYRFSSQWGFNEGNDTNWRHVDEWEEMDLGPIYERTVPGGLGYYEMTFRAPSNQIVIFIRAWNKWAYPDVELDFNLDDISLEGCGAPNGATGGPSTGPNTGPGNNNPGGGQVAVCTHTVSAGESLGVIASKYGADINDIVQANDISNPNYIYPGQVLLIPGCNSMGNQAGPSNYMMPDMQPVRPLSVEQDALEVMDKVTDAGRPVPEIRASIMPVASKADDALAVVARPTEVSTQIYTVQPGQSLGQIAADNGVDAYSLATVNGITNMDFVYVGQQLRIP